MYTLNATDIVGHLVKRADCIHPGYGFLSENQAFASACEARGIEFIGPPNAAIEVMGDKARAKRAMIDASVPCVPGYQGNDQSNATLIAEANKIGMPVMVKAAAGGGGRGMRLVHDASDLESAIELNKAHGTLDITSACSSRGEDYCVFSWFAKCAISHRC